MSEWSASVTTPWTIPPQWAWTEVRDIGTVALGRQRSPANHHGPHMRSYVRAANIRWSGWDLTDVKEMNFDAADFVRFQLRNGDVLVNEGSGSAKEVGKSAIWRGQIENCCFQNTLIRVQPKGCTSEYLSSYFMYSALTDRFITSTRGINIHHIGKEGLAAFPVPVPPLPEQRRIVAKIDSLTGKSRRARDHLDHIPRLVEKYKQAVLAAAFRGDLTREWRVRNRLAEPKQARLPELLAEPIRNGLSVRGSDSPPGVRSLRLSALRTGTVDLSDVRYLPIADHQAERFLLKSGDVLVGRGNGTRAFVGLAALVGSLQEPTIFPDTAFRLRLNESRALPQWIAQVWNAPPLRFQIEQAAKTTAGIWKIAQYDLDRIEIIVPSIAEQNEIIKRLGAAFSWIERLASEVTDARKLVDRLDQAVLAKAFRGELVPQDPADEPASVLLERISAERKAAPKSRTRRGGK